MMHGVLFLKGFLTAILNLINEYCQDERRIAIEEKKGEKVDKKWSEMWTESEQKLDRIWRVPRQKKNGIRTKCGQKVV